MYILRGFWKTEDSVLSESDKLSGSGLETSNPDTSIVIIQAGLLEWDTVILTMNTLIK